MPDPGQRVALLVGREWRGGFRAASGPLSAEGGSIVILVAEEGEYLTAAEEERRPIRMPWPLEQLRIED